MFSIRLNVQVGRLFRPSLPPPPRIDEEHVIADYGVSSVATKLCERPEGRRLFDMLRAGDALVVRWVDRLGRNYDDVVETIQKFMKRGHRHQDRDQRVHV